MLKKKWQRRFSALVVTGIVHCYYFIIVDVFRLQDSYDAISCAHVGDQGNFLHDDVGVHKICFAGYMGLVEAVFLGIVPLKARGMECPAIDCSNTLLFRMCYIVVYK